MRASRSHGGLREHFLVRIIFQDWKESQSRKIKNTFLGCCFATTMIVLIFCLYYVATSQITLGSGACSPGRVTACKILEQDRHTLQENHKLACTHRLTPFSSFFLILKGGCTDAFQGSYNIHLGGLCSHPDKPHEDILNEKT